MAKRSKLTANIAKPFAILRGRVKKFMSKRPHRSLRLTRRRDYVRPLNLPGYFSLTAHVGKTVWSYKKQLMPLTLVLLVLYVVLVGIGSQSTYSSLLDFLKEIGEDASVGEISTLTQAGVVLMTISTVGFGSEVTEVQLVFSILIVVFGWLVTVWLLRNLLANKKVNLRDGLYNAGAPLVSTLVIVLVFFIQLLPLSLAAVGFTAATNSGLIEGGVEAMLFWIAFLALTLISVYWSVSSFFALVIVTLPGTYPFKALSIAGDMMVGRRLKFVLRILWGFLLTVIAWVFILIVIILLDMWLKNIWTAIDWLPLVPFFVLVLTSFALVWLSSYIYLLYRKVVDEDAKNEN